MKRWTLTAVCTAAVLSLAACSTSPSNHTSPSHGGHATTQQPHRMHASTNETLQAYHWYLDKAEDAKGAPQPQYKALAPTMPVRLDFVAGSHPGEQTVSSKLCNNLVSSYTLEGKQLQVGNPISTMMACENAALMQLERAVAAQMGRMQSVQIEQGAQQPRLVLSFTDGSRWQMVGQPTDATRYGGPGETVFMEIAAQTQPCVSGAAPTECLQVREVRYDSAGRKTVAPEWQNFHGSIDGFEFQPGMRHVLRLKRYPLSNPAADGAAFAYVKDMTVEVELLDSK